MAETKIFNHLNLQGLKINGAVVNSYADKATAEAEFTTLGYGLPQKGMQVVMLDTLQEWTWDGTAFVQAVASEIMINVASAPIDTDVNGTIVTGTAPTLTPNIKLISWTDANGRVHLYQVNGATITEITEKSEIRIVNNTVNSKADVEALTNLRRNTVYENVNTGFIAKVLDDGNVIVWEDDEFDVTVEFQPVTVLANSTTIFDINGSVATPILERLPNSLDSATIEAFTANMLEVGVEMQDDNNADARATAGVTIKPVSTTTFSLEVVVGGTFTAIASFKAKKQ